MHALPHIPILMGTRNGAAYLHQQLASFAAQDHPHWSLWISDDGSTDATREVIRDFADTSPNPVLLLRGPQQGLTANYLHLLCHPDLPPGPVAFADQDDLWLPTHLTRGLSAVSHDPPDAAQAYVPHRLLQRGNAGPQALPWRARHAPSFRNALVENLLVGSGLILNPAAVSAIRAIGPVDVPFWDWWLYLLFTGSGAQILQDRSPGVIYRAHDGNMLGPRHGLRANLRRLKQLRNGTYHTWFAANLAALEPHMSCLTPEASNLLQAVLAMPAKHRLRHLSPHRHLPRDRLALWVAA
ncbi:glycosyltransferase [Marivita sp. S0852]|uniref:glycosyltransferase n=1 Tax=Marivita sp. S0852 TaxID=3373893 RepID=UPI0039823693